MPAAPRSKVVREGEIAIYHTWSRCVQQMFLCGRDRVTGQDFEYRREWLESLLVYLAGVFAIDVGNYQVLSNHVHLISRTRPDIANGWSNEEVAWRWKCAWPHHENGKWVRSPTDEEIEELLQKPDKLAAARAGLASISWLMARWKEPFSRLANAETNHSGTCWESRFGAREICGDGANLLCNVYVDLNQLRAGMASDLEQSNHSAIQQRIRAWRRAEAEASVKKFLRGNRRADLELQIAQVEQLLAGTCLAPISESGPLKLVRDVGPYIVAAPSERERIVPGLLVEVEAGRLDVDPQDGVREGPSVGEGGTRATLLETVEAGDAVVASGDAAGYPLEQVNAPGSEGSSEESEIHVEGRAIRVAEIGERSEAAPEVEEDPRVNDVGDTAPSREGRGTRRGECGFGPRHEDEVPIYERRHGHRRTNRPRTYNTHRRLMVQSWRPRVSDNPILSMSLDRYLAVVQWTAMEIFTEQNAPMPPELQDELRSLGVVPEYWVESVKRFGDLFHGAVGPPEELAARAARVGGRTIHGMRACRAAFS